MSKVLHLILAVCLSNFAYCQTVFAEFDLALKNIDYVQAFQVGDSIFLSFSERNLKRNYWIRESKKPAEINLQIPSGAPIVEYFNMQIQHSKYSADFYVYQ